MWMSSCKCLFSYCKIFFFTGVVHLFTIKEKWWLVLAVLIEDIDRGNDGESRFLGDFVRSIKIGW